MIVYFHRNPTTYEIFYVGIGTKERRAYAMDRRNPYWKCYVNKYGRPVVQVVHPDLSKEKAKEWEVYYINLLKRKCDGGLLTNITEGGDHHPTEYPEVRERIKQKSLPALLKWMKENPDKNSMFRPEVRAKISGEKSANKRPEQREKFRIANLGKKASVETKLKQSLLKKGKPSNQPKGYKHSAEVKERMKIINKEISSRPEVREKLRLINTGRISKKRIPVLMIDPKTNKPIIRFDSGTDACKYFNQPGNGNISLACNGKRNFAYGYKWKYAS